MKECAFFNLFDTLMKDDFSDETMSKECPRQNDGDVFMHDEETMSSITRNNFAVLAPVNVGASGEEGCRRGKSKGR